MHLLMFIRFALKGLDMIRYGYRHIDQVARMFANGLRARDSIPGRVIPKTQEMVLDTSLLKT